MENKEGKEGSFQFICILIKVRSGDQVRLYWVLFSPAIEDRFFCQDTPFFCLLIRQPSSKMNDYFFMKVS